MILEMLVYSQRDGRFAARLRQVGAEDQYIRDCGSVVGLLHLLEQALLRTTPPTSEFSVRLLERHGPIESD